MWQSFIETLQAQLGNQVVAGAVALGLVGVVAAALRNLPAAAWSQLQRLFIVTVTLDSRNEVFEAFMTWLDDQRMARRSRWFMVVQGKPAVAEEADGAEQPPLQSSPAPGLHLFWHRGHLMWLRRDIAMNLQVIETVRLSALLASRATMDNLLKEVQAHAGQRRAHRLALYTVDRWGEQWHLADAKPRRSLDSVVLDADAARQLHDDIHEFFARREWYAQLGIPWRRGYLLYGPPGTGKTSVAYALAGELQLKLCVLSLTNPKLNDHSMADLLQRTPPRSLILIEDIDAFFQAREKQDGRIEISFSGLLNALDGVAAQEGRIIVLTTNHRDRLDPELIRPGRIDVAVELANATPDQLRRLFLRFFPDAHDQADAVAQTVPPRRLSPAQVQQALLDAANAADAVKRLTAMAAAPSPALAPAPASVPRQA
jgi:mitochondrial chaperone BCS1